LAVLAEKRVPVDVPGDFGFFWYWWGYAWFFEREAKAESAQVIAIQASADLKGAESIVGIVCERDLS
jgi:hypothetical protein